MKKIFGWLVCLSLAVGLVGCKKASNSIVLKFTAWGGPEEAKIFQQAAQDFEKDHPGVEVQMMRVPYNEYITKLLVQFSAGAAPDVMEVAGNDQFPAFASKGVFEDLKPYVVRDPSFHLGDFYPEAVKRFTRNGAIDAIPQSIFPLAVVYYNKKAFDEAKLPYPKDDWTIDQMIKTAQALTKTDAKGNTSQFGFMDEWPNWEQWVYSYGGWMVDNDDKPTRCVLDSPKAIAGVQLRADLINKYKVMPAPSFVTAMGGLGNSDLFINGKVVMYHSGLWQVPSFRQIKGFDWDVVEFPKGPKGRRALVMEGWAFGMVKGSAHPDLAYELVKYLTGEKGQQYMAATGSAQPALMKVASSKFFLDGQTPKSKGFLLKAVKDGHFEPFDPQIVEWRSLVLTNLDRVWSGTETAEQVLTRTTQEVNTKFFGKK